MPFQMFHRIECFCVFHCQWQPFLISGKLISEPYTTWIKAGAPIINGSINNITIFINRAWIQYSTRLFYNISLDRILHSSIINVILNKVFFNRLSVIATCQNQQGKSQYTQNRFHNTWIICDVINFMMAKIAQSNRFDCTK